MRIEVRRVRQDEGSVARSVASDFKVAGVSLEHASEFLANPANYLIIAEADGRLAGFVVAYRLDRLDRSACQLLVYEVDVAPDLRRRGIGAALMAFVRQIVAEEGLMEAFAVTEQANEAAVALYRRTGAQQEGETSFVFVYAGAAA